MTERKVIIDKLILGLSAGERNVELLIQEMKMRKSSEGTLCA